MVSGSLFREFLIVRSTRAIARLGNASTNFDTTLESGHRITNVADAWELKGFTFLADMGTGMVWAVPATCVIELSGRFRRST